MVVRLQPELSQLIDEQVKLGHFSTPEAVIEAAMAELLHGEMDERLDDEDLAAIAEADSECDRGEGIPLDDLRREFSKQYGIPL